MVQQILDADPLVEEMLDTFPKALRKRLHPREAGEAIVSGIEKRAPRIIRPKRWIFMSVFRGILNPLIDKRMERDATVQKAVVGLDARAGEKQTDSVS